MNSLEPQDRSASHVQSALPAINGAQNLNIRVDSASQPAPP